jgi:hypothetical protein
MEKNIKNKCAWCGEDIPGTEEYYIINGNACNVCLGIFSKMVKGLRGVKKTKKGKLREYKIRDYTNEEKDQMIKDRIDSVKVEQYEREN